MPASARYMLLSAAAFSVMTLWVKIAGQRLPSQQIVTARAALTLLFTFVLLRRASIPFWGRRKGLLVLRGLLGFVGLSCVYHAVTVLPLAEATVIQYTHPVFTALLASLFLGEPLRARVLQSMAMSMVGVVLVAQPETLFGARAEPLDPLALLVALGGAFFSSAAYVVVRRLGRSEHPLVIVFYFPFVALPASLPATVPVALWPTAWEWLALLGVGLFTQLGQVWITKGLAHGEAGRAATYSYSQVFFAALWGALFFDEQPTLWTVGGALLILSGALWNLRGAAKASGRPHNKGV